VCLTGLLTVVIWLWGGEIPLICYLGPASESETTSTLPPPKNLYVIDDNGDVVVEAAGGERAHARMNTVTHARQTGLDNC
jgi:hypothetical protein